MASSSLAVQEATMASHFSSGYTITIRVVIILVISWLPFFITMPAKCLHCPQKLFSSSVQPSVNAVTTIAHC